MPSIALNPTTTTRPATIDVIVGGLSAGQRCNVRVDGTTIATCRAGRAGGFEHVGLNVGSTATLGLHTVELRDTSNAIILATADLTITADPVPPPPPPPTGWIQTFDDIFDRTVVKGHFIDGGTVVHWTGPSGVSHTAGTKTADGRYIAFGTTPSANWPDTSRHGTYAESGVISIGNGKLTQDIYSDLNGYGHTCVITPIPAGSSVRGGQLGMRALVRARADALPGFKGVFLGWADRAEVNADLMRDGEIDGPEGPFNARPKTYLHRTAGTSLSDQLSFDYPIGTNWQDWNDYIMEWIPADPTTHLGGSVKWYLGATLVGATTSRIPYVPMHFNIQPETNTGSGPWPAANIRGKLEIARITLWKPA